AASSRAGPPRSRTRRSCPAATPTGGPHPGSCPGGRSQPWAGCRTGHAVWPLRNSTGERTRPGPARPGGALALPPARGDHDLDPLEFLQVRVAGGGHGAAQRAHQVHRPVGHGRRPVQDLLDAADRADRDPRAARQVPVVRFAAPVVAPARANGEPTMTASAPSASALAMSPLRVIPPSAITCAYRPPDSSR